MSRTFFASLILSALVLFSLSALALDLPMGSTSGTLTEEVMVHSSSPHQWDWRRDWVTLDVGYTSLQEFNSFEARSYNLGFSTTLSGPWVLRGALRKVTTAATPSSDQFALTPFSQAAQPSRYEALAGAGYTLLEGRNMTALSPSLTDVGEALYAIGGVQYNFFPNRNPEPIPGMRAIYYDLAAEVGLRFQVFLPHALGLGLEWTYSMPLSNRDPDLGSWQRFSGNLSWSFGR